jgi:hypothetical protein
MANYSGSLVLVILGLLGRSRQGPSIDELVGDGIIKVGQTFFAPRVAYKLMEIIRAEDRSGLCTK